MLLDWKIRYLNATTKELCDRWVYLLTEELEPSMRAAIELFVEDELRRDEWAIVRFRHLFTETELDDLIAIQMKVQNSTGVGPSNYFEDEDGNSLSTQEMIRLKTGRPGAIVLPSSARSHDAEFVAYGSPEPPVHGHVLSESEIRILAYFQRDLVELLDSEFLRQDSPTISATGSFPQGNGHDYSLKTAATDEEIRSFVTIFRRLYMQKEVGCYWNATETFAKATEGTPSSIWVGREKLHVESLFGEKVWAPPFFQGNEEPFTCKRLLDVFIYTQYAHQPDERRQRQFNECLRQVNGMSNLLTWLFLRELTTAAQRFARAGRLICRWFQRYVEANQVKPDFIASLRDSVEGIGHVEKAEIRSARLKRERIERLARELSDAAGNSPADMDHFRDIAASQLAEAMNKLIKPY